MTEQADEAEGAENMKREGLSELEGVEVKEGAGASSCKVLETAELCLPNIVLAIFGRGELEGEGRILISLEGWWWENWEVEWREEGR